MRNQRTLLLTSLKKASHTITYNPLAGLNIGTNFIDCTNDIAADDTSCFRGGRMHDIERVDWIKCNGMNLDSVLMSIGDNNAVGYNINTNRISLGPGSGTAM